MKHLKPYHLKGVIFMEYELSWANRGFYLRKKSSFIPQNSYKKYDFSVSTLDYKLLKDSCKIEGIEYYQKIFLEDESTHFRRYYYDITKIRKYPYHRGGKIYYQYKNGIIDSTKLFIAYQIEGNALFIEKTCEGFEKYINSFFDCPFEDDDLEYPFMLFYEFTNSDTLTPKLMNKFELINSELDSFKLESCN
jgi:hypothetical protein